MKRIVLLEDNEPLTKNYFKPWAVSEKKVGEYNDFIADFREDFYRKEKYSVDEVLEFVRERKILIETYPANSSFTFSGTALLVGYLLRDFFIEFRCEPTKDRFEKTVKKLGRSSAILQNMFVFFAMSFIYEKDYTKNPDAKSRFSAYYHLKKERNLDDFEVAFDSNQPSFASTRKKIKELRKQSFVNLTQKMEMSIDFLSACFFEIARKESFEDYFKTNKIHLIGAAFWGENGWYKTNRYPENYLGIRKNTDYQNVRLVFEDGKENQLIDESILISRNTLYLFKFKYFPTEYSKTMRERRLKARLKSQY